MTPRTNGQYWLEPIEDRFSFVKAEPEPDFPDEDRWDAAGYNTYAFVDLDEAIRRIDDFNPELAYHRLQLEPVEWEPSSVAIEVQELGEYPYDELDYDSLVSQLTILWCHSNGIPPYAYARTPGSDRRIIRDFENEMERINDFIENDFEDLGFHVEHHAWSRFPNPSPAFFGSANRRPIGRKAAKRLRNHITKRFKHHPDHGMGTEGDEMSAQAPCCYNCGTELGYQTPMTWGFSDGDEEEGRGRR